METASLRAKQDISKATQDATTLQNDRDSRDRPGAPAGRSRHRRAEPEDCHVQGPDGRSDGHRSAGRALSTRRSGGGQLLHRPRGRTERPTEMAADENTPVLPGDVIKVGVAAIPAN